MSRAATFLHGLLAVAAVLFLSACGGGDASPNFIGPAVFLSPSEVSVAAGGSIELQVDIDDLPTDDRVSGYSISLSEAATHIAIESAECPPGTGTSSCRRWTITPEAGAVPGEYGFAVRAAGVHTPVKRAQAMIRVLVPRHARSSVLAASRSHLVTNDGRLWGTGPNTNGQAGIGFRSVGFDADTPIVLPERLEPYGYLQIGADTDWLSVVTGVKSAIALKRDGPADDDGTVWGWGANPEEQENDTNHKIPFGSYFHLGFSSDDGRQLVPRRIPGLTHVVAISEQSENASAKSPDRFWALKKDGTVWAWGGPPGPRYNMARSEIPGEYDATDQPLAVLRAVSEDGIETRLDDVKSIAGGTSNIGQGWGVAIRGDGSVWQVGSNDRLAKFIELIPNTGDRVRAGSAMARQVAGLPGRSVAVAVGEGQWFFSLALTEDGQVWTWTEAAPTAQHVDGLVDIVAIDARDEGANADATNAIAIDSAGQVWKWRVGGSVPVMVARLPPMARTASRAPELVITRNCPGESGGALWHIDFVRIPDFYGTCPFGGLVKLNLSKVGEGSVTTEPGGDIQCSSNCVRPVEVGAAYGEALVVRATPAPGWKLDRFNDECHHGHPELTVDTACIVTFVPETRQGTLKISVVGSGSVTTDPAGIDCGTDCEALFNFGAVVTLNPVAEPGYRFARWRGEGYLDEIDCRDGTIGMNLIDGKKACIAEFEPVPQLSVTASANGTVLSTPAGIDCGATCAYAFSADVSVTLRATPAPGYRFDGFRETVCNAAIRLEQQIVCTPVFTSTATASLAVSMVGDGRVTSADGFIDCTRSDANVSGLCNHDYPLGMSLTLTALPADGWSLESWSANCLGGKVLLDVARACGATFVRSGWQQFGPDVQTAGVIRTAIAVDHTNPSAPITYVATSSLVAQHFDLIVRRFDGLSWSIVGSGPINDPLLSSVDFTPSIAVDGSGKVTVAWAENGDRIRVSQWNGTAWSVLANNLKVDPSATVFDAQLVTSGGQLIVAWLETAPSAYAGFGQLTLKHYDPAAGWTGGTVGLATPPAAVFGLRVTADSAGRAMLMFAPAASPAIFVEGPPRVVREAAPGTWAEACGGSLARGVPGNGVRYNVDNGFGIARNSADQPVVVFNNGDSAFAVECRGGIWSGLDGSGEGAIPGVGSVVALAVAHGETDGVALALYTVHYLPSSLQDNRAQVLMQRVAGAPLVASQESLTNLNLGRGLLALAFASATSPVLAVSEFDSGGYDARVYRFFP